MGNRENILLNLEALSFNHAPPSSFTLREFKKTCKPFLDDYSVYQVGRKPNLPDDHLMDKMAADYAVMIR